MPSWWTPARALTRSPHCDEPCRVTEDDRRGAPAVGPRARQAFLPAIIRFAALSCLAEQLPPYPATYVMRVPSFST